MIRKISIFFLVLLTLVIFGSSTSAEEKWKALDEAVIEKIAQERGKEPKALFELEGDLELFLFTLLAGASGFVAGYFWRRFVDEKEDTSFDRGVLSKTEGIKR